jgi:hypothetical protein
MAGFAIRWINLEPVDPSDRKISARMGNSTSPFKRKKVVSINGQLSRILLIILLL